MSNSVFRALAVGVGIIIMTHIVWFFALQAGKYFSALILLLWLSPFFAAVASVYLMPQKSILLGISMVLSATIVTVAVNLFYQWFGHPVDFSGERGALILFTTTLIYSTFLCGLGSMVGSYLARKFKRRV